MCYCVIEGIPALDRQAPLHLGIIAALESWRGRTVGIPYLAGVSGEAWRFLASREQPDIDAAFAGTAATLVQGLQAVGIEPCHRQDLTRAAALALVRREIAAGRPVLAVGTEGWGDWGIVTGYCGEAELLCRNAIAWEGEYQTVGSDALAFRGPAGCETISIAHCGEPPGQRGLIQSALAQAVLWFDSLCRDGYLTGRAAYEQYTVQFQDMRELGYSATVNVLTWARCKTLAAGFVQEAADLVGSPELAAAADQYDTVARNWDALRGLFGMDQEENLRDPRSRREGANILRDALSAETRAIQRIREALQAGGET